MAFKGTLYLVVIAVGAFSLVCAAVTPEKDSPKKKAELGEEESAADPRLFFIGTTGTGTTTGTTTNTSITISTELLLFLALLLAAAIAAAIAIPIAVGVGVGKKYKGKGTSSDYGDTGYGSAPAFVYSPDESSYASIHRSLEDAADKYD
ncbi:uncharacterized protein LOC135200394 [Macrobrachium nipponense]|uniref:uncharacterized protein LOC135200394 n=1 Tax=Macrobrachium nipponense TaxID=159736 RepID=UPI0030C8651B